MTRREQCVSAFIDFQHDELTEDRRACRMKVNHGLDLVISGVYRNLERGGHVGVWGLAPSGVQGQRPGGGSGGEAPLKLKGFL